MRSLMWRSIRRSEIRTRENQLSSILLTSAAVVQETPGCPQHDPERPIGGDLLRMETAAVLTGIIPVGIQMPAADPSRQLTEGSWSATVRRILGPRC